MKNFKGATARLLTELRDSLWNEHVAGTTYEDEEHDPFNGRNGGRANNGKNWEGNECDVCALLLEVDKVLVKEGVPSRKKK